MSIITTEESFDKYIKENKLAFAFFFSEHNKECIDFKPKMDELCLIFKNVCFVTVDVDECKSLLERYNRYNIDNYLPSFLYFVNEDFVYQINEVNHSEILRKLMSISSM
jgi:thiol-disulfide isomerase/thioredoxin